ncbi:MAG TPA: 3-dehydroquinate synthase, partial [Burkholderiales bacterium]|nr:3-dehydroquinate synthase [Burkholderiales bacterium]
TRLSQKLGFVSDGDVRRVDALLRAAGLPVQAPALGLERYLELMGHDKKVDAGRIRFVLLKRIGDAFVSADVPRAALAELLDPARQHA